MILELPLPISVNQAYAGNGRRFKSKKYKEWELRASEKLLEYENLLVPSKTPLRVKYTYFMPCYYKNGNHKKVDAFNYEKVLSDFLEHNIEGFEDEWIYKGVVEKVDSTLYTVYIEIEKFNLS